MTKRASHYLRIILDDIFGEENFRSEIIWTYKRWSNSKKDYCQDIKQFSFIPKQIIINLILFIQSILQLLILTKSFQERVRIIEEKQFISMMTMVKLFYQRRGKGTNVRMFGEIPFLNPKAKKNELDILRKSLLNY